MKNLNTRFNTNNTIYNLRSVFYILEMNYNYINLTQIKYNIFIFSSKIINISIVLLL